ncbi:MAG TPA: hypothetical protein VKZ53_20700 [Candidatus Angelobacter sp.]|nr:hypothetical protein [Candidatus Angelobacter sp.]
MKTLLRTTFMSLIAVGAYAGMFVATDTTSEAPMASSFDLPGASPDQIPLPPRPADFSADLQ